MNVRVEKPKTENYWKPLVAVLVIAGILILWPHFAPRPFSPLAFEIINFEGDARIYDLQSHSWRALQHGEGFKTAQGFKTGADGKINFQIENEIHLRLKENSELKAEALRIVGTREVYKLRLVRGVLLGATTRPFERKQKAGQADLAILTRDTTANIHGAIFRVQTGDPVGLETRVGVLRGFAEVSSPSPFFRSGEIRIRGLEQATVANGAVQPVKKVSPEEWDLMKESYELLEKTAVLEAEQIDLSKNAGTFFNHVFDHGTFFTPKVGYAGREFFKDPDSGQVFLETEYDVFPAGSFCGVYIKTRDFDISKYAGLSLEVRRNPEEGIPESFFIELKSKSNVVRRYALRTFERNWKPMEFDFRAQKPLPVDEVVFVFTNARAGEAKKGVLEFRHINLIPLPPAASAVPKSETETVTTAPSPSVVPQPATPRVSLPPSAIVRPAAQKPVASSVSSGKSVPTSEESSSIPQEVPLR